MKATTCAILSTFLRVSLHFMHNPLSVACRPIELVLFVYHYACMHVCVWERKCNYSFDLRGVVLSGVYNIQDPTGFNVWM